ncbi:hypothetical protein M0R45_027239 [Rubus argutus]|uniref:NAC domain-containing protein n=1 Tax=Rubus argutus TaxID=59490 RepID=A0AAW1X1J6_RUBAR
MDCVPVGVRFHPTDEELIGHYLYMKNNPDSVTASTGPSFVPPEFDLYGETEPWIIWEAYGGPLLKHQDLFFFTRLKKAANTRINRKIGSSSGTWSQGEPSKPIFDKKKNNDKGTPIGRKTKLRYENKLVPEQHGCWYMEEYTALHGAAQHDYVICRFRENRNRSSSSAEALTNYCNKRKYQYDDHSEPTKKPRSLRVAATTTTNESPDPEEQQQFDAVEMFHPQELFRNDDDDHQMAQPFSHHLTVHVEDDQENDDFLASLDQWLNTDDPIDNDGHYPFSDSDVEAFLTDSSISGLF